MKSELREELRKELQQRQSTKDLPLNHRLEGSPEVFVHFGATILMPLILAILPPFAPFVACAALAHARNCLAMMNSLKSIAATNNWIGGFQDVNQLVG